MALTGAGVLAGCPALSRSGSLSLSVSGVELRPGEAGSIALRATGVRSMAFVDLPEPVQFGRGPLRADIDREHLSPTPRNVEESFPPTWGWADRRTVRGEFPVEADPGLSPGEYEFTVRASGGDDADERATATVSVLDGSG